MPLDLKNQAVLIAYRETPGGAVGKIAGDIRELVEAAGANATSEVVTHEQLPEIVGLDTPARLATIEALRDKIHKCAPNIIFTDRTIGHAAIEGAEGVGGASLINIDALGNDVLKGMLSKIFAARDVSGEEIREGREKSTFEEVEGPTATSLAKLFTVIQSSPSYRSPKRIYIIRECIEEHMPMRTTSDQVIGLIEKALRQANIGAPIEVISKAYYGHENIEALNQEGIWVLKDRHDMSLRSERDQLKYMDDSYADKETIRKLTLLTITTIPDAVKSLHAEGLLTQDTLAGVGYTEAEFKRRLGLTIEMEILKEQQRKTKGDLGELRIALGRILAEMERS